MVCCFAELTMTDNEMAMDKYGHAWRVGDMSLCLTYLVSWYQLASPHLLQNACSKKSNSFDSRIAKVKTSTSAVYTSLCNTFGIRGYMGAWSPHCFKVLMIEDIFDKRMLATHLVG